jgi:hypothetical protein
MDHASRLVVDDDQSGGGGKVGVNSTVQQAKSTLGIILQCFSTKVDGKDEEKQRFCPRPR